MKRASPDLCYLRRSSWCPRIFFVLLPAAMVCFDIARAATVTWDITSGDGGSISDGTGNWSNGGGNWNTGSGDTTWNNATPDSAVIGAGGAAGTISLTSGITVSNITFNAVASGSYLVQNNTLTLSSISTITANTDATISSILAGTAGLIKAGGGTLVLTAANNSYTGDTAINGGALEIGGAGRLGSGTYDGNIALAATAVLKHNSSANQTLRGVISGAGGLIKTNTGVLVLSTTNGDPNRWGPFNTFTGAVVVDAGELDLNHGAANEGSVAGKGCLTINSGAKVVDNARCGLGFAQNWNGAVNRIEINGGTLQGTYAGNTTCATNIVMTGGTWLGIEFLLSRSYANPTIITLAATNTSVITPKLSPQTWDSMGPTTWAFTVASGTTPSGVDLLLSGELNAGGTPVSKAGAGVMAITSTNAYTGSTTITNGTLQLGTNGPSGSIDGTIGVSVASGANLAFKRSDSPTFSRVVSGAGGLSQFGSGTVYLTGANTYSGVTTITNGTLNANTLANVNTTSAIGKGSAGGSAADLVIDGGVLQYTGSGAQSSDRLFTVGVSGATLDASGGLMTMGSAGGSIAFSSSSSPAGLVLTGSGAGTLSAVLPDSGTGANITSLTKTGTGSWTLTAANTFTGNTTVNAGRLYLNGANSTTNIAVAGGATLGGSGSAGSATGTVAAAGTVEAGSSGVGSLTLAALTFTGGGTGVVANVGNYTASPAIGVTASGGLSLGGGAGSVTIKLGGNVPVAGAGTAHIFQYAGALGGTGFSAFALDTTDVLGLGGRSVMTLNNPAGYVDVDFSVDYPIWKGAGDGTWVTADLIAPFSGNWKLASTAADTDFVANDAPLFDDTVGAGLTNVNISAADVVPYSVIVSNDTKNYKIEGLYGIAGSGPLVKRGAGTLTIASTNKFSGQLTVEAGTLAVGTVNNVSADGPLGNSALAVILGRAGGSTGTLEFTSTAAGSSKPFTMAAGGTGAFQVDLTNAVLTVSGNIGGSGDLAKTGLGRLILSGTANYGKSLVRVGALQFGKKVSFYNNTPGSWTPVNVTVDSGAILAFNVGGSGEFTTGDLDTINDGSHLGVSTASAGLKSGSYLGIDTGSGNVSYSTAITNVNNGANVIGLYKLGNNILTLSGLNTYTGGTVVDAGELDLNTDSGNNGTLRGALTINPGAKVKALQDHGFGFARDGTGPYLENCITNVVINYGTLEAGYSGGNVAAFRLVTMTGGTMSGSRYDWAGAFGGPNVITVASATQSVISAAVNAVRAWSGTIPTSMPFTVAQGSVPSGVDLLVSGTLSSEDSIPLVKSGAGLMALTATNTYGGATTISAGTLQLGTNGTSGSIDNSSGVTVSGTGTISFKRSDSHTFSKVVGGTGNLSQLGSGTVYLTGLNSYSGVTTVATGVLDANLLANRGSSSSIGTGSGVGSEAALVINGGTLKYSGAGVQTSDRLFTIGPAGATLDATLGSMTLGSAGGSIAFSSSANPGTLTLAGTGSGILSASVGNSGAGTNTTSLTKTGTSTWTLTAANTFTGNTTVNAGRLYLNGANSTTNIAVAGGAALGGSGSAGSATGTVAAAGTVEAGSSGVGSLTLAALTFTGGGTGVVANVGNYTASPAIGVTASGGLSLGGAAGSVTIKLGGNAPAAGSGTAHIFQYAGALGGTGFSAFALDTTDILGLGGRSVMTLNNPAGYVDVNFSVDYPVWKGAGDGTWVTADLIAPFSGNWKLASTAADTDFVANDAPLFNDTVGAGLTNVNISAADVVPSSVVVSNDTKNYTIEGLYGIAGTGPLVKRGTGTLTMASTNKFGGQLTVEAGTLAVGTVNNASADGPLGNSALAVILGRAGGSTGTLEYTSTTASSSKPFTMAAGGTGAFQVDLTNAVLTVSGNIGGSGDLVKTGPGRLILSGTANYGRTLVKAGTLQFGKKVAFYNNTPGSWTPANVTVESGTVLGFSMGGTGEFTTSDINTLTNSAHMGGSTATTGMKPGSYIGMDTSSGNYSYGAPFGDLVRTGGTNSIGLVKLGTNILTITYDFGPNPWAPTFSGGTIVDAGELDINGNAGNNGTPMKGNLVISPNAKVKVNATCGLGYSPNWGGFVTNILINGGTLESGIAGNTILAKTVTLNGGTISGLSFNYGSAGGDPHFATLASSNMSVMSASFNPSGWDGAATAWPFTVEAGTVPSGIDLLVSGVLSGGIPLTKAGNGLMRVSAVNTYSGATTINAGTLQGGVGGSCANSAVTVSPSGTAVLGVAVTNNSKQWSCASLTTSGSGSPGLTFDFGSVTPSVTLAPLEITGAMTFTKTPVVNVNVSASVLPGKYPLMHWGSTSGAAPTVATLGGGSVGTASLVVESTTLYVEIRTIQNTAPTDVRDTSATFNAVLRAPATNYDVYVHWGPTDGTTNFTSWTNSAYVGSWTNVSMTGMGFPTNGLTATTGYYYTFRATNDSTNIWASPSMSFTTLNFPVVDNDGGPTNQTANACTIQGKLIAGTVAAGWICWGDNDAGTSGTGDWDTVVAIGSVTQDVVFSTVASGLRSNVTYWYRCYATNILGVDWSDTATTFNATPAGGGGGGSRLPVSGAYFEWDAAKDVGGNNAWTSTTANAYTWTFDAGSQTQVAVSDSRFDVLTKAYVFPGARDENNTSFDGYGSTEKATFEFVLDTDTANGIIFESGGTGDGIELYFSGGLLRGYIREGAPSTVSYQLTSTDSNRFMHVIFVADNSGNVFQLYVDGLLKDSTAWSAGEDWAGGDAAGLGGSSSSIPQDNVDPGDFSGKIALFRYYRNTAFNADQVTTNFNALSTGVTPIQNLAPTGITETAASFNAALSAASTNYDVYVHWGLVNGSNDFGGWSASYYVGSWTNVASTNISYLKTGLSAGTTNYYTFRGTNATTNIWATPSWLFVTPGSAVPPGFVGTVYSFR